MKPTMTVALAVVLLGGALLLALPFLIGSGTKGYPIGTSDHISSWSWKGVYADGADKQASIEKQIKDLKAKVGTKDANEYDIYVGIASQYELLGDGKNAYAYLNKAIAKNPKAGLAYMNMGHLMEGLGAFATAHAAYDAAVAAEPNNLVFQAARQNFLVHHPTQ
jgi:tetratricopeptide (TPR) repeat protein